MNRRRICGEPLTIFKSSGANKTTFKCQYIELVCFAQDDLL